MKDTVHHLKNVQKKVIRSSRKKIKDKELQANKKLTNSNQEISEECPYSEHIPSDQRVPRAPTRQRYH